MSLRRISGIVTSDWCWALPGDLSSRAHTPPPLGCCSHGMGMRLLLLLLLGYHTDGGVITALMDMAPDFRNLYFLMFLRDDMTMEFVCKSWYWYYWLCRKHGCQESLLQYRNPCIDTFFIVIRLLMWQSYGRSNTNTTAALEYHMQWMAWCYKKCNIIISLLG